MAGLLLLAWQVKDKHCLVIGGGDVALSRVHHMIKAEAKITVITGSSKTHPELVQLHKEGKIYALLERDYNAGTDLTLYETLPSDILIKLQVFDIVSTEQFAEIDKIVSSQRFAVVCCCIDDYELSTKIYYQCKFSRLPVNIADKPPLCDFYFGSMYNQDNLQIMISTNGMLPRLLKLIKDNIARQFDGIDLNRAIENLGLLRSRLRGLVITQDDLKSIDLRMQWIKKVTDYFAIRQWSELDLSESIVDGIVKDFPKYPPTEYSWWEEITSNEKSK